MSRTAYDTVMVSGGFDPIHVGHVRMIREAAQHGEVIVVANSDNWLYRKKGYNFMGFNERKEILMAINGGDRGKGNTPEMDTCRKKDVTMLWNIGGQKIQSSSELVESATDGHTIG